MTAITSHYTRSSEIRFVESVYHLDHLPRHSFARHILGEFFPVGEALIDMAVNAVRPQRGGKEAHRIHELADWNPFQHLHVFENFFGQGLLRQYRLCISGKSQTCRQNCGRKTSM